MKSKSRKKTLTSKWSGPVSMTGFGQSLVEDRRVMLEIELRSVNHRFFECSLRTPRVYGGFESDIRLTLADELRRGRVDVQVLRSLKNTEDSEILFHQGMFDEFSKIYKKALKSVGAKQERIDSSVVLDILNRREVLEVRDSLKHGNEERLLLEKGLKVAIESLKEMKEREGRALAKDLSGRLQELRRISEMLAKHAKSAPINLKKRIGERIKKLSPDIEVDPVRLAQEVAILADKLDVSEEITRLSSHLKQLELALQQRGTGKKLEFLLQEVGREVNTVGSKAQNVDMQHLVVTAKAEIEKMREQVQNIE